MRPPGPADLFRLLAQTQEAVATTLAVVPQLAQVVGEFSGLVREARVFVADATSTHEQAQALVLAVEDTRRQAHEVADNARATEAEAAAAVREVRHLVEQIQSLMTRFEPALTKLAPLTDAVADGVTQGDAEALTDLMHTAPELVDKLNTNVVPVLDSLGTVGPDLREVMDVTHEMDEMLGAVPGLGRVKKRVENHRTPRTRRRAAPVEPVPVPDAEVPAEAATPGTETESAATTYPTEPPPLL